jgi:hypothetical protein
MIDPSTCMFRAAQAFRTKRGNMEVMRGPRILHVGDV